MAIDFFGAQDKARRNTGLLVFLFAIAVILLLFLTNLVVCIGLDLIQVENIRFAYQQKALSRGIYCRARQLS